MYSYFYPLYNQLEDAEVDVKVAHPLKVRLIAKSYIKSDKIDALVLAQLLRLDYLPTIYIPLRASMRTFSGHTGYPGGTPASSEGPQMLSFPGS